MRVDLFGLTMDAPGVTFYLWSPWRCSALEHKLFDALKGVPHAAFEAGPDELRVHVTEPKGWKAAVRVTSLKFLRPEICLEDGTVERTAPTGVKEVNRFAIVWTKTGDKWLISSVRDQPADVTDLPSVAAAPLAELGWLVGEWTAGGDKAEATIKVSWGKNKAFLLMDYGINQAEGDPLEVTVRVGWDPRQARIRSWVFDSTGGFAEAFWRKDGKRWIVGTAGVLPDGGDYLRACRRAGLHGRHTHPNHIPPAKRERRIGASR